jgi:hypothetical protein
MRSDTSTRSQSGRLTKWLVSGPPFVFLLVFFVVPAAIMVVASVRYPGEFGALAPLLGAAPGIWLAARAGSATTALLGLVGAAAGATVLFLVALLRTVLAPAAAAVEGGGGWAALRRSSRLMAPRPGQPLLERPGVRASLLLLTTFLLALAVNGLASLPRLLAARAAGLSPLAVLPGALPPALELVLTLFEACAGAALQPFSLAAIAVFYFERRARTEGIDLTAWVAAVEAP